MSLRLGIRNGDCIVPLVAEALGFSPDVITETELKVCREFAFSSNRPDEFAEWYLRSEAFSKFDDGLAEGRQERFDSAMQRFHAAEAACRHANSRIVGWDLYVGFNPRVWRRARATIASILGPFPWERFPLHCQFGPGASVGLSRRRASYQNKWVLSTHITEAAIPYYTAFRRWANIALPEDLTIVGGNKVTTVPKSYKTDRTIAIEPDWNCFLQAGVGRLIRSRLRRIGLLQPDAQYVHQRLAQAASSLGHLATLDLSAASDSVSLALCEALLPEDWFRVLVDLRSPLGFLPGGKVVDYAKISSMGNGFTFELETLLFYGLTVASCDNGDRLSISVYGDDIICPDNQAEDVIATLHEAGFQTNGDKSFFGGSRFRESCGGHYFDGVDVKPFYIRNMPDRCGDAVVVHNNVLAWHANQRHSILDPEWGRVIDACRKAVPKALFGPWGVDGVIWANWDEARPQWSRRYQCYKQKTVKTVRWMQHVPDETRWGAILQKLWIENADAETSWAPDRGSSMEVFSNTYLYRDQWQILPVRLA